jgi:hypothetical protein
MADFLLVERAGGFALFASERGFHVLGVFRVGGVDRVLPAQSQEGERALPLSDGSIRYCSSPMSERAARALFKRLVLEARTFEAALVGVKSR